MYSSTNNNTSNSNDILYPFLPYNHNPHLPQEFTTSSVTPFGLHQDQFFLANNFVPISSQICDDNNFGGHPYFDSNEVKQLPAAAASRKDRHSKIYTAQGFRDRRVRLSINIAREFFDLQDLLGFDKASQTLKWLLNKSKTAINDLAKSKSNSICRPSLSSSSNLDLFEGAFDESDEEKRRKAKEAAMARMSRMQARARARERTKGKMCNTSTRSMSPNQICSGHLSLFDELNSLKMNQEQGKSPAGLCSSPNRRLELNPRRMEGSSNWDINGGFLENPSFRVISTNMNPNSSGF